MNKKKIIAGLSAGALVGIGTIAAVAQECAMPSGDEVNVVQSSLNGLLMFNGGRTDANGLIPMDSANALVRSTISPNETILLFSFINFVNSQSQTPNIVDVDRIRLAEGGTVEVQAESPADTSITGALTATITGDFSIIFSVADTENPQVTYTNSGNPFTIRSIVVQSNIIVNAGIVSGLTEQT